MKALHIITGKMKDEGCNVILSILSILVNTKNLHPKVGIYFCDVYVCANFNSISFSKWIEQRNKF